MNFITKNKYYLHYLELILRSGLLFYFVLFCLLIINISCNIDSKQPLTLPINSTEYYNLNNKAESLIVENNFYDAVLVYDRVFTDYQYMFARDLNNAIRCSVLLEDWERAAFYGQQLILKGVPLYYFDDAIFEKWKETSEWKNFKADFNKNRKAFLDKYNSDLHDNIMRLVNKDQQEYCEMPEKDNYSELKEILTPDIDDTFLSLIKKHGFPSEEKIGVRVKANEKNYFSPIYSILYIHSFQSGDDDLIKISKKYIDSLLLDKRLLSSISNYPFFKKIYNDDNIYISVNTKFDEQRELELKKLIYNSTNEYDFYLDQPGLSISHFADSISKQNFVKYSKKVGELQTGFN